MSQKLVVGPFNRGLRNDVIPPYVDNDSFPTLINAYQWRGRVKRKRGTAPICRLERYFASEAPYTNKATFSLTSGAANLITEFSLNAAASFVPGSIEFTDSTSGLTYQDIAQDGNLLQTAPQATAITGITRASSAVVTIVGSTYSIGNVVYIAGVVGMTQINNAYYTITGTGVGTITINVNSTAFSAYTSGGNAYLFTPGNAINYATGAIAISGGAGDTISATSFVYYPDLPAMDIEALELQPLQFPQTLAFDTTYSYQIITASPYYSYDVSFYKNPPSSGSYTAKTNPTPLTWNGQNYQQFWSVNYENAIWVTNGITQPFTTANIGMQYLPASAITSATQTSSTTVNFVIPSTVLVVGDFVFANEFTGTSGVSLNFQTGYVTNIAGTTYTITFPNATIGNAGLVPGILQLLTNSQSPTVDCLRWYDGDPTNGSQFSPTLTTGLGWVNFMPPIESAPSQTNPDDLPPAQYYLVGARMIIPYKDRLLFLGPVIQSSVPNTYYLQDTIIYSQNGTPYYTASFTGSVTSGTTVYTPLLTPASQSATANAYFTDAAGYGGFITAGYSQPMTTVGYNQDVLIVGFTNRQVKVLYTGNDLVPFNFYIINSELGSTATFSTIVLDRGVISIGDKGFVLTDQQSTSRFDLEIPDQVFEFDLLGNGTQRITAARDFVNEWIYFSYPYDSEENQTTPFPNQTLFYNYRDQSWGIFDESYTTYGPFRRQTGFTWATVGSIYPSWSAWNEPWNSSSSSLLEPEVIAGNQQGFIVARRDDTGGEAPSLYISAINTTTYTITSPNHGLNSGDFIFITGVLGVMGINSSPSATPPTYVIWQITVVDSNNFTIASSPLAPVPVLTGTYVGAGVITRLYVTLIQSKQFPMAWGIGRKTRIGVQQYLFTTTATAQITLNIYLSQNAATAFNQPPYAPDENSQNNAVVYSNILFTCQESTNLGLTPAQINLQQTVPDQEQTWHRQNTSLIGDTVQVGFTLSPIQMFDPTLTNQVSEIELHGLVIDVTPSQMLS